jgi:GNAT superfamily N-acetyltransferase
LFEHAAVAAATHAAKPQLRRRDYPLTHAMLIGNVPRLIYHAMDFYYLVAWASEPRVIGTIYAYPDFDIKGYYGSIPSTILYGLTLDDELYTHDRYLRMGVATAILTAIENDCY